MEDNKDLKSFEPTPKMTEFLVQSGHESREKSLAATHELAKAVEGPIRRGVMYGDILDGVFQRVNFRPGAAIEFVLDFLRPGTEKNWVAYAIPNHGRIPERHIEGDVITISTYEIAASIDWLLKHARDARWDIVAQALQVLRGSFVKKLNDDGFHVLLAAAVERNIVVYDSAATAGAFTKRLVSLMQQVMRRNSGGNSTSLNRGRLTDIFMSPEALEDVRNWSTSDIDEVTRREIFVSQEGRLNRIFGVNLHDYDEFGEDQEYQEYYLNELGGTLATGGDTEMVLGLDLSGGPGANGTFVMPVRQEIQIFEDDNLHRQRRAGFYGWGEFGFSILDSRKVVIGSL
jgi:hypothetical protein